MAGIAVAYGSPVSDSIANSPLTGWHPAPEGIDGIPARRRTIRWARHRPDLAVVGVSGEWTRAGSGGVVLHYRHALDTRVPLRVRLETAIGEFQRFGFLRTIDGRTRFGFIHGNNGLDDSNGSGMCGVADELRLLR